VLVTSVGSCLAGWLPALAPCFRLSSWLAAWPLSTSGFSGCSISPCWAVLSSSGHASVIPAFPAFSLRRFAPPFVRALPPCSLLSSLVALPVWCFVRSRGYHPVCSASRSSFAALLLRPGLGLRGSYRLRVVSVLRLCSCRLFSSLFVVFVRFCSLRAIEEEKKEQGTARKKEKKKNNTRWVYYPPRSFVVYPP